MNSCGSSIHISSKEYLDHWVMKMMLTDDDDEDDVDEDDDDDVAIVLTRSK
jgi:hypothetical protein